jgi:FMN-dependent NADH-azoreductase
MKVLHVCANPKPVDRSVSKELAASFFSTLVERNADAEVINVDLYKNPPPYLSDHEYRCFWESEQDGSYEPSDEEMRAGAYAVGQCEQFNQADVLVLTMPLWNGGVPAILKSWIEHVLVPGLTYERNGTGQARPLHHVKRIILLVSSGDKLSENDPADALSPQIRAAFGSIGIDDIQVAWADGQDARFHIDHAQRRELAKEAAQELAEEVAQIT